MMDIAGKIQETQDGCSSPIHKHLRRVQELREEMASSREDANQQLDEIMEFLYVDFQYQE
jgi:hypothetical protein